MCTPFQWEQDLVSVSLVSSSLKASEQTAKGCHGVGVWQNLEEQNSPGNAPCFIKNN